MATLTHDQERLHRKACQLVDLSRDLTDDEREFVLDNYRASTTGRSRSDRAHFTPSGLAQDMHLEVTGDRIIDLAAGIGRLAHHNRGLWSRWPNPGRDIVCIERNPEYVRVGQRVMPEARWICADIMTIPQLDDLGEFDCAISNPPYGAIPRSVAETLGYCGRRFEYHTIALASTIARRGVFIIPQIAAPFRYSGRQSYEGGTGDTEYHKFVAATGIELNANCGIDTTYHQHDWHDVNVLVEIVTAEFTERAEPVSLPATTDDSQVQLALC